MPVRAVPPIATAGYEGLVQDQLIDRLRSAGVAILIDIRAVPNSRKPGFSKRILAASLENAGIGYVHLQALGTPKAGRQAARKGDGAGMAAIFGAHLATEPAQEALGAAAAIVAGSRACLLCFERDPHLCHRRLVAEAISAKSGQAIIHL